MEPFPQVMSGFSGCCVHASELCVPGSDPALRPDQSDPPGPGGAEGAWPPGAASGGAEDGGSAPGAALPAAPRPADGPDPAHQHGAGGRPANQSPARL